MVEIIVYIVYTIAQFFDGKGDVGNSITEIELAKLRTEIGEHEEIKDDTKRRKKWHFNHAITSTFIGVGFAIAIHGFEWVLLLSIVSFFNLRQLIFNPVVGLGIGQSFFYVSKGELFGVPYKLGKWWWFLNLLICIAIFYIML